MGPTEPGKGAFTRGVTASNGSFRQYSSDQEFLFGRAYSLLRETRSRGKGREALSEHPVARGGPIRVDVPLDQRNQATNRSP